MATLDAAKQTNRNWIVDNKQIKRLFTVLSTASVPEPKTQAVTKPQKPTYLRYIEYV